MGGRSIQGSAQIRRTKHRQDSENPLEKAAAFVDYRGYYKALKDKSTVTTIDESAVLQMTQAWLPDNDYFEWQFEIMKNIPLRTNDVDFLYVLRFCYESWH